jgi:8-oxo-dGTP pyrophosphatase MutT (NUDIX family)
MSYLDRIKECNHFNLTHFKALVIGQHTVGWLKHSFAEKLKHWPENFAVGSEVVKLTVPSMKDNEDTDFECWSATLREVNGSLAEAGIIHQIHGELYPVKPAFEHPAMMVIDRAAASYYGIKAWGQHLNGYVRKNGQLLMWIARRSKTKGTFPGKLDNMVAGGLPHDISLRQNIIKECQEEASIPAELLLSLQAVGSISYCVETDRGLKPDCLFCYDLELPESFQPVCQDGEVDEFFLLPLHEVASLVRETNEFKPNCDLTIIDFLIRHGFIQPDEKDYLNLVYGLRPPLHTPAPG